ncbi:tripartite tricarboxylate transporter substrate binding protein [Variovorax defluvii]|uniref:Tripartite tricarboxylate transporter substrate binding protein n=1 Tax=Variovorax defluvii TaxID=913761 RepID=A0ABP8I8L0_9BURK
MLKNAFARLCAGMLIAVAGASHAFPDKAITIQVPFSPGTTTDVNAREFAQVLSEIVKQPVVVDNKVGAEGQIGASSVLNAPPDGHMVMFTSNSLPVLDPLMKKGLPYNPIKDFAPICAFASTSNVMNITASSPYKTVGDFIAAAKAQPGKFTFGYASAVQRLAGELFQQAAGIKLTAVPYRSSLVALTEVAGGQVDLIFIDHVSAMSSYQNGRIRPIAVAGKQRYKAIPDVPPASEAGVPGYDIHPWFGFYASAKTPPGVLEKMRDAFKRTLLSPATAANMEKRDLQLLPLCGDEMARHLADDVSLTRRVLNKAGIEPQ